MWRHKPLGFPPEKTVILKRENTTYLEGESIPPAGWSRSAVEAFALKVGQSVTLAPGGDLQVVVDQLGGRLHYVDMNWLMDDQSGTIYVHQPQDFDVLIPGFTSPRRDRFTIAHELGHYFLHASQGGQPIIAYRRGTGRCEWEANWFAASLLMPEEEFIKSWHKHRDPEVLASVFGVSLEAAEVRRKTLRCE
jgi:predicted transcriptional regulator